MHYFATEVQLYLTIILINIYYLNNCLFILLTFFYESATRLPLQIL